jgi:hypothetical protein
MKFQSKDFLTKTKLFVYFLFIYICEVPWATILYYMYFILHLFFCFIQDWYSYEKIAILYDFTFSYELYREIQNGRHYLITIY